MAAPQEDLRASDKHPIPLKVSFDEYYLTHHCFSLDIRIIFRTFFKVIKSEGVKH